MFSPPQIFNEVSADFFSHSLTARLKARHHINLFKYLDIIQLVSFFSFLLCQTARGRWGPINIPRDSSEQQLGNKRP